MEYQDFNEMKKKRLESSLKNNQMLATITGATASLGAVVSLGNLIIGNEMIAAQNMGTTAVMIGYTIGYLKKNKIINEDLKELNSLEEKNIPKDRLIELKKSIEELKISLGMSTTASIGFGVTTIANMALLTEEIYVAVGAMLLTGSVTILNILLAHQQSKKLNQDKKRLSLIEDIDEISKEPIPELIESKEDEKRLLK